jgi:leucyl-tRNA synthetase
MPISAAAKKLAFELETYGNPPKFPENTTKYQYEIMQQLGIKPDIIPQFVDPYFWVKYFPPIGR